MQFFPSSSPSLNHSSHCSPHPRLSRPLPLQLHLHLPNHHRSRTFLPKPPYTLGYTISHFSLVISDPSATIAFYRDVLGLRTVLNYDLPGFTFPYFGYPAGGKNGTGYQLKEEMLKEQNNREGLLKFIHSNISSPIPRNR